MDTLKLPELPDVVVKGIVTVKSEDLKILVDAYNTLASTVTTQQHLIENLINSTKACREDITKIAKILEAFYET